MRAARIFLFLIVTLPCTLISQTDPAKAPQSGAGAPKQAVPSKDNPQGYSKDMFDDSTKTSLSHPKESVMPRGKTGVVPDDAARVVKQQFGEDCDISMVQSSTQTRYLHPQESPW